MMRKNTRKYYKSKKKAKSGARTPIKGTKGTNKKGFLEVSGQVIELLPNATFKVQLENDHEILAHLSGKMRMHKIRLITGDTVTVEISPYDLTKGRITYRN